MCHLTCHCFQSVPVMCLTFPLLHGVVSRILFPPSSILTVTGFTTFISRVFCTCFLVACIVALLLNSTTKSSIHPENKETLRPHHVLQALVPTLPIPIPTPTSLYPTMQTTIPRINKTKQNQTTDDG